MLLALQKSAVKAMVVISRKLGQVMSEESGLRMTK